MYILNIHLISLSVTISLLTVPLTPLPAYIHRTFLFDPPVIRRNSIWSWIFAHSTQIAKLPYFVRV